MGGEQRRIVITGVGSGLGRALCEGFAGLGHLIDAAARRPVSADEMAGRLGPPHTVTAVDVTDDQAMITWAETVLARGVPDLLICNAAVINTPASLWQVRDAEFTRLIDVNVTGVYRTIRHFVPAMVQRRQGVVVTLSSGWGRSVEAGMAPYCASKWAIEGLTRALAADLPAGMAAVAVNPGVIDTPMLRSCWADNAGHYPGPSSWAAVAVPWLLRISPKENGRPLTVPAP